MDYHPHVVPLLSTLWLKPQPELQFCYYIFFLMGANFK